MGNLMDKSHSASILSKYPFSKPSDTKANITWSAEQLSRWEYRLERDESLFNDPSVLNPEFQQLSKQTLSEKYVFVYSCLSMLLARAIAIEKVAVKLDCLQKERGEEKLPKRQLDLDHRIEYLQKDLNVQLSTWDHGKFAYEWLRVDYELTLDLAKVRTQMVNLIAHQQASPEKDNETRDRLRSLQKEELSITEKWDAHDKEALAVGLGFLDRNMKGGIKPSDLPSLSAELFVKLDLDKDNIISPKELIKAISNMADNMTALWRQQWDIQQEKFELEKQLEEVKKDASHELKRQDLEVKIERKAEELTKIHLAYMAQRQEYIEAFSYFRNSFTTNVFGALHATKQEVDTVLRNIKLEGQQQLLQQQQLSNELAPEHSK